jgi:hypothetical protein
MTDAMRLTVFILAIIALAYSEPDGGSLLSGRLLPLLAVLGLAYVFWFGGFAAMLVGAVAWYFMDVSSVSTFKAVLLPVLLGLSVCYLAIWSGLQGGWFEPGSGAGCDGGDGGGCDGG